MYSHCVIRLSISCLCFFFFFNDTATTEIYTLSLHDALPICPRPRHGPGRLRAGAADLDAGGAHRGAVHHAAGPGGDAGERSEEHMSELQSQSNLVCRLLLEKKKEDIIQCMSTAT